MIVSRTITGFLIAGILTTAGLAASPLASVHRAKEVTLRLAVEQPAADGSVRGALALDLAEGWHTYWIDPGASGIPPTLDFAGTPGLASTAVRFPPPHRFGKDLTRGIGYSSDVALAFELEPKPGEKIGAVEGKFFLGVCRDICIPVQAELGTEPSADARPLVEAAFAALPETDAAYGTIDAAQLSPDGEHLLVTVDTNTEPVAPDLFVTGPKGWYFDEPEGYAKPRNGKIVFEIAIVGRPSGPSATAAPPRIHAVYTDGSRAFERDVRVDVDEAAVR